MPVDAKQDDFYQVESRQNNLKVSNQQNKSSIDAFSQMKLARKQLMSANLDQIRTQGGFPSSQLPFNLPVSPTQPHLQQLRQSSGNFSTERLTSSGQQDLTTGLTERAESFLSQTRLRAHSASGIDFRNKALANDRLLRESYQLAQEQNIRLTS